MLTKHKIEIAVIIVLIVAIVGVITWTIVKMNVVSEENLTATKTYNKADFLALLNEGVPTSESFFENTDSFVVRFYGKIDADKLTELSSETFSTYYTETENSCFTVLVNSEKGAPVTKYDDVEMIETGVTIPVDGEDIDVYIYNGIALVAGQSLGDLYAVVVEANMNATFTVGDNTLSALEYIQYIFAEVFPEN